MIKNSEYSTTSCMWGYVRETAEQAAKAGIDKDTGLPRTGLEAYLKVIFPEVHDWIHNKTVPGLIDDKGRKKNYRPDYRSETLKMIIEFDGLQHYQKPDAILNDAEKQSIYERNGYEAIRIPYFIQLTNEVVNDMFGVNVEEELFDRNIPSMGPNEGNTPAYLCHSGIKRMAKEFHLYPAQYKVNIDYLKSCEHQELIEYELLEDEYNKVLI